MHTHFIRVLRFRLTDLNEMDMVAFLSANRMISVVKKTICAESARTVSILFVCMILAAAGCKRRAAQGRDPDQSAEHRPEVVVTNRMQDAAYVEELDASRRAQTQAASARAPVVAKMEAMVAEVRASLPAGAGDQAVKDELAKRPEWKALEVENARALAEIEKSVQGAREKIRRRMEAEARDVKAVAEGRAVPAEPAVPQKVRQQK